ncbi:hypothetical protein KC963_03550 [Candidatus Saccharibacteria bacterium]|nr:hypothetical protein [Candidatus Saccharibacteria bacterium]MCA9337835.1 hypothetical protein [Candidatus Saccharibacteria bacterium]
MYLGTKPYGLETHIENYGDGSNMLRGETFGQPRTLSPGDVLANGLEIAEHWSEEGNGGVGLHFADGTKRVVASRIPLLLAGGTNGKYPLDLEAGDIFETGCVVLASPTEVGAEDPQFEESRREVKVSITGGLSGHSFGVPRDLMVALHGEAYPPSIETKFGAFVVDNVLKMGARARRNLPNYGRLDEQSEAARVASVFDAIATLRTTAQDEKAAYEATLGLLREQCEQLKGVELLVTGRLQGRGATRVYKDDPRSWVEDMLVEVTSASVNTYEGHGGLVAQHQPFIEFYGRSVEGDELVGAWIGVGELGVTVSDPNAQSEQE